MKTSSDIKRVVWVGDLGTVQEQVTSALSGQADFELADLLTRMDSLARDLQAAEPDLILVNHQLGGQPTLDIIDDLAQQFPEAPVVAILEDNEPLRAQQVMLAGARAFVILPFTQVNLLSTLRRVRDLEARRVQLRGAGAVKLQEATRPLKIVTVFSPRGGAGCTTVATNLALALLEETGARVLLFEGKLAFGHLEIFLNLRSQNTLADLIPHANALDEALVRDVVSEHVSGLHVLLGPKNIQIAQGIRPDDLYNILLSIQRYYDFVVIDGGNSLTDNAVTLMDAADRILLVANPEMASLHDTSVFVQLARSLSYSADKLMMVLNRAGVLGGIRSEDVETALHHLVFAQIPDDGPNALRSLDQGVPLAIRYPRSPATKAIRALATSLAKISTSEPVSNENVVPALDQTKRAALLASSRLG
jgi:pilus assembly protein CpaE